MRPYKQFKIQHLRQLAQGFAVSQFLQSFGIILAVFCSAIPYRGTDFHIQNCAAHDRSALRNRESAIAAPLFRQLPQWSNPLRHDTLRMTKFVCSAVPLPLPGAPTHKLQAPPARRKPWQKRNRWISPAAHLGHQRNLAGVYESCKRRGAGKVYGMLHGVAGLLERRTCVLDDS